MNFTIFSFPDSLGDDLTVEIYDSKGKVCGRVLAQLARVADDPVRTVELLSALVLFFFFICFLSSLLGAYRFNTSFPSG